MRQNSLWQEAFKLAKPHITGRHHSDTQGIRCMSDARDSTSQASGSHRVDDGGERIALKRSTTNKEAINVGLLSEISGILVVH